MYKDCFEKKINEYRGIKNTLANEKEKLLPIIK
jgi:hypothetical protein